MIEQHIIEWIELGDSIQKIELYNERSITFYEMNYLLSQYNNFSEYFYFFIIILYFLQIWELNIETLDENGDCIKCMEGYYLTSYGDSCTSEENCFYGDKDLGICISCEEKYYIDFKDGKCKSNKENNDFKYCKIADGKCFVIQFQC